VVEFLGGFAAVFEDLNSAIENSKRLFSLLNSIIDLGCGKGLIIYFEGGAKGNRIVLSESV
jgi:hypothetical protein